MNPSKSFNPTGDEIIAAVAVLVQEQPDLRGLPRDALKRAAVNRLRTRHNSATLTAVPPRGDNTPPMLKSKGVTDVTDVTEVVEDCRSSAADTAALPNPPKPEPEPAPSLPDVHLTIPRYIQAAATYITTVVTRGLLPERQALFEFLRVLKAHPTLSKGTARKAWECVERSAGSVTLWAGDDEDDVEAAFFEGWASVRLPAGVNPLVEAQRLAVATPLQLHLGAEESRPSGYAGFISLAGWLCVVVGSDRIKLPCEAVATVLGVTAMTISRYCKFAVADNFLTTVKKARHQPGGKGEARTFRFQTSYWKLIQESLP